MQIILKINTLVHFFSCGCVYAQEGRGEVFPALQLFLKPAEIWTLSRKAPQKASHVAYADGALTDLPREPTSVYLGEYPGTSLPATFTVIHAWDSVRGFAPKVNAAGTRPGQRGLRLPALPSAPGAGAVAHWSPGARSAEPADSCAADSD